MRSAKIHYLALLVCLVAITGANADEMEKCSSAPSSAEGRECKGRIAALANNKMAKAEDRVRAAIRHWDREQRWKDEALTRFERYAKAFRAYQEDACDFEGSSMAGGTGTADVTTECSFVMAKQRTKLLNDQAKFFRD